MIKYRQRHEEASEKAAFQQNQRQNAGDVARRFGGIQIKGFMTIGFLENIFPAAKVKASGPIRIHDKGIPGFFDFRDEKVYFQGNKF